MHSSIHKKMLANLLRLHPSCIIGRKSLIIYIRCCGRTTLVCCVGLRGSDLVLPTTAWDLT